MEEEAKNVLFVLFAIGLVALIFAGPICCASPPRTDAKSIMGDSLKKIDQQGSGLEFRNGEFTEGSRIFRVDAVGELPILTKKVHFACSDNAVCGSANDAPLAVINDTHILVNKNVAATIAVCKVVAGTQNGDYYVCVGDKDDKSKTSEDCADRCGLN